MLELTVLYFPSVQRFTKRYYLHNLKDFWSRFLGRFGWGLGLFYKGSGYQKGGGIILKGGGIRPLCTLWYYFAYFSGYITEHYLFSLWQVDFIILLASCFLSNRVTISSLFYNSTPNQLKNDCIWTFRSSKHTPEYKRNTWNGNLIFTETQMNVEVRDITIWQRMSWTEF